MHPAPERHRTQSPTISAVVIARNDEATIERSVRSVVEQDCDEPFEVILVASGTDATAQIVRERFPCVRVVELNRPALPGAARNAGLRAARGRYVSFPGSHIELPPGSLAARLAAHRRGYALVTGSLINGTRTWAGWANYFLDNRTALPARPSKELGSAPVRCSYERRPLVEIGGFPEDVRTAEDTIVNDALFERGHRAYRSSDVVLVHNSPCRRPGRLLRHHFTRGRGAQRAMLRGTGGRRSLGKRRLLSYVLGGVVGRVLLITHDVARWGDGVRARFLLSLPLVVAGATSWWIGMLYELSRHRPETLRAVQGTASPQLEPNPEP